jgi:beta-aspartyl-peptidase (threonine type)
MITMIVHGGATEIPPQEEKAYREGCLAALSAGWKVLEREGSAVDAVEAALRVLESDPTFNAGYGGALTADGVVELDAALMEGADLRFGSVAAMKGARHPSSAARRLLDTQGPRLLVAEGAERFAREQQLELCDPAALITERQRKKLEEQRGGHHDTVGCVALDIHGLLATGASTGGLVGSPAGRVGDSPVPGGGLYADNQIGGCAFSGDGEKIAQLVLAKMLIELVEGGLHPDVAAERAIARLA